MSSKKSTNRMGFGSKGVEENDYETRQKNFFDFRRQ